MYEEKKLYLSTRENLVTFDLEFKAIFVSWPVYMAHPENIVHGIMYKSTIRRKTKTKF